MRDNSEIPTHVEMDVVFEVERDRLSKLLNRYVRPGLGGAKDKDIRVISIGCGVGYEAAAVTGLFPFARFVGVDKEKSQITLARAYNKDVPGNNRINFVQADASKKEVYGNHPWDVVLLRNPQLCGDSNNSFSNYLSEQTKIDSVWGEIVDNAVEALSENGVMLASTVTEKERDVLLGKLESKGNLIIFATENEWDHEMASLGDQFLFIIKKAPSIDQ